MKSLTLSNPFRAEAHESVGAIFLRLILNGGVLVGLGCAFMLWGLREPVAAIGSLVLVTLVASLVARRVDPGWPVGRAVLFAGRAGVCLASSAAVVEIAGATGVLLVALCLVLSPFVRKTGRDLVRGIRHIGSNAPTRG